MVIAHTYDLPRIRQVAAGTAQRLSTLESRAERLEAGVAFRRRIGAGVVAFFAVGCLVALRISSNLTRRSSTHEEE